ncbi:hypothetical protein BUE93_22085 [Chromobacterium amazonense]|uniref:Bacterial virulence protein VirB8 domain-containing protein n=1 Tax=Chromobacterium amazonense TaxID=1382803 RepID=A0A2S9WYE2_9NEIS|nr:type IV secretion system protein [Chromobacterium amazonense]PRP68492.1 hypothetical protein BUE93_22085 [Chromobacterium amazonense]
MKLSHVTEQALAFESVLELKNQRSIRAAWSVAGVSIVIATMAVGALMIAMPLKTTELRVVAVDSQTGMSKELTSVDSRTLSENEALSEFFVSRYISLRTGYNYMSLQNDYDTVQLYSSPQVKDAYLAEWAVSNSPDVMYGQSRLITGEAISISIQPGTDEYRVAQVRVKLTDRNLQLLGSEPAVSYANVTLTYAFNPKSKMSAAERLVNPLGFKVMSWHLAKELKGAQHAAPR